jgi:hypothetical protein
MLTRAAPAIDRALGSVMTQGQLAQFMSAVNKCSQPLEARAPVTFNQDSAPFGQDSGGGGGLYQENGGGWNPQDYPNLFPQTTNNNTYVDIANNSNYRAGDWISNYYAGPNFDLRTNLTQNLNQYFAENHYAGNTINVAGNTSTTNLTTNNITTENITTNNINNYPTAPGPSGPQGDRGLDGKPGAPGQAGAPGRDGGVVVINNQFDPSALIREINRLRQEVDTIKAALRNPNVSAQPPQVLTPGTEFDPDTCELDKTFGPVTVKVSFPGV